VGRCHPGALAPAHIIESGLPTEVLLAQIAISKYADDLPLFLQEGIYARDRVEIDRRQMAQWMGRVSFELEILAAHVMGEALKGPRVFSDETSLPTLAPGTGAVKKAGSGPMPATTAPLAVAGRPWLPTASRTADPENAFADISAVTAAFCRWTDMLPAISSFARMDGGNDGPRLAGCWAGASISSTPPGTARSPPPRSDAWLICGSSRPKCAANVPKRVRRRGQAISAPIVTGLFTLWQQTLPRISGKSKLAEPIRYAIARREIFNRFLTDSLIEPDSNIVERAIRPQTIIHKNILFAGSDGDGRTWATIATLLQTSRMNNVDPAAWLTQTLGRIANQWSSAEIDALMPWNHRP